MPVYGFESQDDFNRAKDSILWSESQRTDLVRKPRKYPRGVGGGGSPRCYVITEDDGSGGHIAVYRGRGTTLGRLAVESETSCLFEAEDEEEEESEISLCFMSGVSFTGQALLCQRISGVLSVIHCPSSHNLLGTADGSIAVGATGDITIPGTVGGGATIQAENTLDFQVEDAANVYVMFDDSKQTFYIVAAECPA